MKNNRAKGHGEEAPVEQRTIWNILVSSPSLFFCRSRGITRFRGGALARIFSRVHLRCVTGIECWPSRLRSSGKTGRTGHALNITGPHWQEDQSEAAAAARDRGGSRSNSRSILLLQYRIRIKTVFCATRIPLGCNLRMEFSKMRIYRLSFVKFWIWLNFERIWYNGILR